MIARVLLLCVNLILMTTVLKAAEPRGILVIAEIGGVAVRLPLAEGYCLYDSSVASEKAEADTVKNSLAGKNDFIAMFAECEQLQQRRTGVKELVDDTGVFITPISARNRTFSGNERQTLEELCGKLGKQSFADEMYAKKDIKDRITALLQKVAPDTQPNGLVSLGALEVDEKACITGYVQQYVNAGEKYRLLSIAAMIIVRGKMISHNLYRPFNRTKDITELTQVQRRAVDAIIAANR